MEWIKISKNKLKVMLTAEDARRYALNCADSTHCESLTRAAFRELLCDVRRHVGFDATEDQAYIQMYPSKEGGCELFITKTELARESEHQPPSESAIRLGTLSALLALCRRLQEAPQLLHSEALQDERGTWWLLVHYKGRLPYLAEYGELREGSSARLYLAEHGKVICAENAIQTLSCL